HAGRANDSSSGTSPRAAKYAVDIFPHGVSVSRGSAFETGHALRHSFGQNTHFSSVSFRAASVGRRWSGRSSGGVISPPNYPATSAGEWSRASPPPCPSREALALP